MNKFGKNSIEIIETVYKQTHELSLAFIMFYLCNNKINIDEVIDNVSKKINRVGPTY